MAESFRKEADRLVEEITANIRALEQCTRISAEFLECLCSLNIYTELWFVLWRGGGAYRFTEILPFAPMSRSALVKVLSKLLGLGLIRQVNGKYQAVAPCWVEAEEREVKGSAL